MNPTGEKRIAQSAVQYLLDTFNRDLLSGVLRPGDQIPTEKFNST